ncbi:hypothetical protein B0T24DRAFT_614079 [Lasiosphaeria ovina]|uniref:Uncharacterized protein n=1 Tax=Lasiosphaeria ovina TaxID=92902 RepID=A0AAE0TTV3_9PEZI|nr:hypothetical protein B0T24DRAFT_614079 [Lasiosphaeria ovina]
MCLPNCLVLLWPVIRLLVMSSSAVLIFFSAVDGNLGICSDISQVCQQLIYDPSAAFIALGHPFSQTRTKHPSVSTAKLTNCIARSAHVRNPCRKSLAAPQPRTPARKPFIPRQESLRDTR